MKIHVTLIFLFFIIQTVYTQSIDCIAALINQYNYQEALKQMDKIPVDSMNVRIKVLKASALKALSKYPEAIDCLESLYNMDTTNIQVIIELADCYRALMNNNKQQELYQKASLLQPENKYIMQLLAGVFMNNEQYYRAKIYYLKACKDDTSTFLLKQSGLCYERLMKDDSAIYYYQKAIIRNPEDYQPVFRLANLYKNKSEFNLGIAVADTFLLKHPENRELNRLSGYMHYLNKDFNAAIERFEQSIALSDSSAFVHKYLGYSYFKINSFTNAIHHLEKVFAVDSSDAELCYALALSHDLPKNIRYFHAAINIATPVVSVLSDLYQDLALAYTKGWKYKEALDALLKAYELTPRKYELIYEIAVHYDNWMNDKPTAVKYYEEFMLTRTDEHSPFIVAGTSIIDQDNYRHAKSRIKEIKDKYIPRLIGSDSLTRGDTIK